MPRQLFIAASVVALFAACVPSFQNRRTPSGDFCSDMPVIPAGQAPDREYHRLRPVASDPEARTEAERLESLRKAACTAGADGVIEAANEEVRLANAAYSVVSSGTAITWVRRGETEFKPLKSYPTGGGTKPAAAAPTATPASEPEPAAAAEPEPPPAPAATTKPGAGTAKGTTPAASSSAKVAPTPTSTPKKKP